MDGNNMYQQSQSPQSMGTPVVVSAPQDGIYGPQLGIQQASYVTYDQPQPVMYPGPGPVPDTQYNSRQFNDHHSSSSSSSSSSSGGKTGTANGTAELQAKIGVTIKVRFYFKVYALLTIQLFVTCLITILSCVLEVGGNTLGWAMCETIGIPVVAAVVAIVCVIAILFAYDKVPCNYILLSGYTLGWSVLVGCIAGAIGNAGAVGAAFVITFIVWIGMTLLTLIPKIDKLIIPLIFGALILSILGSVIIRYAWFSLLWSSDIGTSQTLMTVYCGVFAFVLSIYILIDTLLVKVDQKMNSYILACTRIYTDIVYLLIILLSLFAGSN